MRQREPETRPPARWTVMTLSYSSDSAIFIPLFEKKHFNLIQANVERPKAVVMLGLVTDSEMECAGAELVKAISTPLSACVKGFPGAERLHPFERALLDLTIGLEMYEKRLARLQTLRQSAVQVCRALLLAFC